MKTLKLITIMAAAGFIFSCSKSSDAVDTSVTYEKQVKGIISTSCTGCHSASGTKQQPYLDTYQLVKDNSNVIIGRIELPSGNDNLMPPGKKLPQATIDIIKAWKSQGYIN
jgi:uncharacterized membrane protein